MQRLLWSEAEQECNVERVPTKGTALLALANDTPELALALRESVPPDFRLPKTVL